MIFDVFWYIYIYYIEEETIEDIYIYIINKIESLTIYKLLTKDKTLIENISYILLNNIQFLFQNSFLNK